MADIADIGIKVDSSDVKSANSQMDAFAAKGRKAQGASEEFGKRSNKAFSAVRSGALRAQSAIDQLAKRMAQLGGLAVVGGIALSVKRFADFERQLIQVGKTADLEGKRLQELGERVQMIGREVPVSTNRLLDLAAAAGQLGVKGVDNISKFAETLGKLETATDIAGEEGARSLARLLNITGQSIGDVDRLGSAITQLGNNMATTEAEIVQMSTLLGASTSSFKLNAQEVVALSATLKGLGQRAEASATAMGQALTGIQSAVQGNTEAMAQLKDLTGQTEAELVSAFAQDKVGLLVRFAEGLGRVSDQGARYEEALETFGIAGERARRIFGALANGTDDLRKALDMANREWEDNQALNLEAAKAAESFSAQMRFLGNALNEVAVDIGRELAPVILDISKDFRDFVENASDSGQIREFFSTAAEGARNLQDAMSWIVENKEILSTVLGVYYGGRIGGPAGAVAGGGIGFTAGGGIQKSATGAVDFLRGNAPTEGPVSAFIKMLFGTPEANATGQMNFANQPFRLPSNQMSVWEAFGLSGPPVAGSGGGTGGGPDGGQNGGPGKQEISDLEKEYRKLNQQLEKQVVLFGDSSHESEILYETTFGSLKGLKPLQKDHLQQKARQRDLLEEELELQEQLEEQQRDVTEAALEAQRELNEEGERIMEKREREMERQMERQAELLRRPFENAIDGIQDSFADFFNDVFQGGVDSFSKLATSIKNIFFNMISQLASQRIMSAILGGGATVAAGGAQAATGGIGGIFGGGGGGFGLDTLLSGGKALMSGLSFPGLASAGYSLTGSSIGANALGFGPAGGIGILGAKLLGLGEGIGGTIGGIAGSLAGGAGGGALASSLGMAALGPVGAIAGGFLGSAIGGLFGNNEPSSGAAGFSLTPGGNLRKGHLAGKSSQGTLRARDQIAQQISGFLSTVREQIGAELSTTLALELTGARDPGFVRVGGQRRSIGIGDPERALSEALKLIGGNLQGGDPRLRGILSRSLRSGAGPQSALQDVQFAQQGLSIAGDNNRLERIFMRSFRRDGGQQALQDVQLAQQGLSIAGDNNRLERIFMRSFRRDGGQQALQDVQLAQQILGIGENNSALDQVTDKFSDLIATAKRLRLPLEKINEAFRDALTNLETQLITRLQSIKQQANQVLGLNVLLPFRQQLQTGQLSGLSAQDRLAASRQRLEELSQAARAGDISAIREFPQVAQQTLGLGREVFASGPRFQSLFTSVNRTLNEIIAQQQDLQGEFGQGLDLSIRETSQDQIKVLREEFAATRESLEEVREELARRSA